MIENEPPSYFFGTIHVPYTRVWDAIPDNTKVAFARANRVFFAKYDPKATWLSDLQPAFGEERFFFEAAVEEALAESARKG